MFKPKLVNFVCLLISASESAEFKHDLMVYGTNIMYINFHYLHLYIIDMIVDCSSESIRVIRKHGLVMVVELVDCRMIVKLWQSDSRT